MYSLLIHFYLILSTGYHNRVWDPGVDSMYLWLNEDFTIVLLSLRLDVVMIRLVQFIGATFFHRLIWDPGIRLTNGLQSGTLLRSMAGLVVRSGYRATYKFIWDPSINCLRTRNFKEGRFVMSPFWDIRKVNDIFI